MKPLLLFLYFLLTLVFLPENIIAQTPIQTNMLAPRDVIEIDPSIKQKIEARFAETLENREKVRVKIEETMLSRDEIYAGHRTVFFESLEKIRNARKRAIIKRMESELQEVNNKWINIANETLQRLELILDKIEFGSNDQQDTEAISLARSSISQAQEKVYGQASKVYFFEINDESGFAQSIGQTVSGLKNDISELMEVVAHAKQAVRDTF